MAEPAPARFLRRTVIGSDGLRLAVFETARTGPTIVFVHGFPDTHVLWDRVIARLQPRFHCVAYDVRGAGESDTARTRAGYAVRHLVADLVAVLDAVSPDQPVHLVGHDWGSVQAWDAVVRTKSDRRLAGRIASYTTISGPCLDHVHAFAAAAWRGGWRRRREGLAQLTHSWYVYAFQLPWLPEQAVRRYYQQLLARNDGRVHFAPTVPDDAVSGLNLYRANFSHRSRLPGGATTTLPVQVVVPLKDKYVLPQLTENLESFASDLTRVEIDAGHWVPRSRPDELAAAILEFASREGPKSS